MSATSVHERVLIVDDDSVSLRVTALMFEARGWSVVTASDLRSAIDLAMKHQPHLIVTELLLPDVQSLQFVRALRGAVEHDVHVVAVSRASAETLAEAQREGCDVALAKPLDIDEVESHLRRTTRMVVVRL